jgi:hypothetical protein
MCPGRTHFRMARPEGFEPPTLCFEGRYSIQLSYGRGAFSLPDRRRQVDAAADSRAKSIFAPAGADVDFPSWRSKRFADVRMMYNQPWRFQTLIMARGALRGYQS